MSFCVRLLFFCLVSTTDALNCFVLSSKRTVSVFLKYFSNTFFHRYTAMMMKMMGDSVCVCVYTIFIVFKTTTKSVVFEGSLIFSIFVIFPVEPLCNTLLFVNIFMNSMHEHEATSWLHSMCLRGLQKHPSEPEYINVDCFHHFKIKIFHLRGRPRADVAGTIHNGGLNKRWWKDNINNFLLYQFKKCIFHSILPPQYCI